jgi:hypothetical protein
MSSRRVPPARPKPPVLAVEQARRRIARFRKCIQRLEAFDPKKVQKRFGVSEVLILETRIDRALSAAFGYGTAPYFRYNLAATLDSGPLITNAGLHSTVLRAVGGPESQDVQEAQEARKYFSEGKERSIALLQKAICALEDEIAETQLIVEVARKSEVTEKAGKVRTLRIFAHRIGRWWRGRN